MQTAKGNVEARFVVRDDGTPNSMSFIKERNDGLFIGCRFKDSSLKPGYVYEIIDILGVLTIVELGPSHIKPTMKDNHLPTSWANGISHNLDVAGKHLFLTEQEMAGLNKE